MSKAELLTAAGSLRELEQYIEAGADAVEVGEGRFGMGLPGDILAEQLQQAAEIAHNAGAKLYVAVNRIFDNAALTGLPAYLEKIAAAGADAVLFGDPAVVAVAADAGIGALSYHWSPEITVTNYATANYWANKGAVRAVLSRELNMEQVLEFKRNCVMQVQAQIHGATIIFHSRRRMVTHYMDHLGRQALTGGSHSLKKNLHLVEEERQEERYPIYEDEAGTYMLSGDDLCMLESLHELLAAGIDSLKVESLMKSSAYNATVLRAYRQAIDAYARDPEGYLFDPEWLKAIEAIQPVERPLSFGFYYKEQVY